ncbi:MAG: hypothetical protein D3904_13575 [Candidatus Electrothrix sp. EH2]|nr:hypothetical protein [Candidatus Electrothrix sp. EH2]
MVFSSITFLFLFLPVVLVAYLCVGRKGRNLFLLLASLFFYFRGEQLFIFVMLASTMGRQIIFNTVISIYYPDKTGLINCNNFKWLIFDRCPMQEKLPNHCSIGINYIFGLFLDQPGVQGTANA